MKWLLLLCLPAAAWAHGGEDHSEPPPPPSAAVAAGQRTVYAQSATFELTLVYAPPTEARASVLLYLADYATNTPIEGAQVELEVAMATPVKAQAEATGHPGEYHAVLPVPPGHYPVIATIQAGAAFDLVEIKDLDFTQEAQGVETTPVSRAWIPYLWAGIGALALVILALVLRRRGPALALVALLPLRAQAHGGEDHSAPPSPEPARGQVAGVLHLSKPAQFLLGIRTQKVVEGQVQRRFETLGRVVPRADGQAEIHVPQAGRLAVVGERVPFLGDPVTAGQVLVRLEQVLPAAEKGQVQAERARASAGVAEAQARRGQLQRELARLKAMKGLVAARELEEAQLAVTLATRDVERARAEGEAFGSGLGHLDITSPIDGVIAQAEGTAGAYITPDRLLFTVIDPRTLWVEAEVFPADASRLQVGGVAVVRAEGAALRTGKTLQIGLLASATTRTVQVIVAVDNPEGHLRPGEMAEVAFDAGAPVDGLVIPDAAIVEEGGRRFVFVHTGPESFVRREVRVGPKASGCETAVCGAGDVDRRLIETGLKAGERVVVAGGYTLRTMR